MGKEDGKVLEIRAFRESDQEAVVALWRECDSWCLGTILEWISTVSYASKGSCFLVGLLGASLVATVMAGYEGHRGWINYLAVAAECRKRGFGRRLMDEAEARLRYMGCPKVNLQVRSTNVDVVAFYRRIGYSMDDVVGMGKRLEEN